jgi:hypothetical protein
MDRFSRMGWQKMDFKILESVPTKPYNKRRQERIDQKLARNLNAKNNKD